MKMGALSVNGSIEKWRLRTKSSKIDALSVNPDEILAELVEQHCI
jgi:hypothetical protein